MEARQAVLVTGGAGFIGTALAERWSSEADRWVVFDNLHPQVHASGERPPTLPEAVELVVGSVDDPEAWDKLLSLVKPDIVVHLAAETGTAQSLNEATRHAQVNVVGTTAMLDAFGRHDSVPAHLVLSSSRAVYGEGSWLRPDGTVFQPGQRTHAQLAKGSWDFADATGLPSVASSTPPAPTSVYGATKLAQEHIMSAWAGAHGSALSVLRLQNVYGPGQSLKNSYTGIVSLFSQLARSGLSIPLYEDGLIVRDFVFISDVVDAFAAILDNGTSRVHPPLDVGFGEQTSILQLADVIADYYDSPPAHISGQFRDGDVRFAATDVRSTLNAIQWTPKVDLRSGIAALQEWICAVDPR